MVCVGTDVFRPFWLELFAQSRLTYTRRGYPCMDPSLMRTGAMSPETPQARAYPRMRAFAAVAGFALIPSPVPFEVIGSPNAAVPPRRTFALSLWITSTC